MSISLYQLQLELDDLEGAKNSLELTDTLSPFKVEGDLKTKWLMARRCDLACRWGNFDEAAAFAERVTDSEFRNFIRRCARDSKEIVNL